MAIVIKPKSTKPTQMVQDGLLEKVGGLTNQINSLTADREEVYKELALLLCPFHPGQRVMTDVGLGKIGLQVSAVVPPKAPMVGNLWEIQTFAISKAGEVTQRTVCISEELAELQGLRAAK